MLFILQHVVGISDFRVGFDFLYKRISTTLGFFFFNGETVKRLKGIRQRNQIKGIRHRDQIKWSILLSN